MLLLSFLTIGSVPLVMSFVGTAVVHKSSPGEKMTITTSTTTTTVIRQSSGSFDYEYIPPENNDGSDGASASTPWRPDLSSSYPAGVPAGMRGEAVRAALQSGRCIGWKFDNSASVAAVSNINENKKAAGLVRISGAGCLSFLNNKLTNTFEAPAPVPGGDTMCDIDINNRIEMNRGLYRSACLLNSRGQVVDVLGVATTQPDEAFLLTSPGHDSTDLFKKLDKFVFPLDQVKLKDLSKGFCQQFALASTKRSDVQDCFDNFILPKLRRDFDIQLDSEDDLIQLPDSDVKCLKIPLVNGRFNLLVLPLKTHLPENQASGFLFNFVAFDESTHDDNGGQTLLAAAESIWNHIISEDCTEGPIEIGAAEYETLRIEAGLPAFGSEMTAANEEGKKKGKGKDAIAPANPAELYLLPSTVDLEKGCYLGQEGVASVLKNKRGPARTLYQVVFEDEFNVYDTATSGVERVVAGNKINNLTRRPEPGDYLCVLGSNEEILAGRISSVAEPAGTGRPRTIGLALIRRADAILKQMKERGLEIEIDNHDGDLEQNSANFGSSIGAESITIDNSNSNNFPSEIIAPPPLVDPLEGLEVIVRGTFSVGRLQTLPGRPLSKNTFERQDSPVDQPLQKQDPNKSNGSVDQSAKQEVENEAVVTAAMETETDSAAAAESDVKRKEEKMEMLRARAEQAMLRRKQRGNKVTDQKAKENPEGEAAATAAEAEAKRKEEKMELLRARAEEAMARRKQRKNNSN